MIIITNYQYLLFACAKGLPLLPAVQTIFWIPSSDGMRVRNPFDRELCN